jgi:hypothetical protein
MPDGKLEYNVFAYCNSKLNNPETYPCETIDLISVPSAAPATYSYDLQGKPSIPLEYDG